MLALLLAAAMACLDSGTSSTDVGEANPGSEFSLSPGRSTEVTGGGPTVRFDRVSGDSRCPRDVQCIWAGDATVEVTISGAGVAPTTASLHALEEPHDVAHGGWLVRLTNLAPAPVSTRPIAASEYVATFVVSRGNN